MSEQSKRGIFGDPGTAQPIGLGVVAQRPNFADGTAMPWDTLSQWLGELKAKIEARPQPQAPALLARGWAGTQSGDATLMLLERVGGGWVVLLWKGHSTWISTLAQDELERLLAEGPDPELAEALAKEAEAREAGGKIFAPCPFCRRNTARGREKVIRGQQAYWVECAKCGAIGPPSNDEGAALEQWNSAYKPKFTLLGLRAKVAGGEGDGSDL